MKGRRSGRSRSHGVFGGSPAVMVAEVVADEHGRPGLHSQPSETTLHPMNRGLLSIGAAIALLNSCATLPEVVRKPVTKSLPAPEAGPLVTAARGLASERAAADSSLLLLPSNKEALDWRLALVDSARSSIDIQLYLWHPGSSGRLLFYRVLRAADRGVRVRILVDDFLFQGDESRIAAICRHHPNLDIRIFNPTTLRGNPLGSAWEFLFNFAELNRRMHNKTFTADRSLSIVGGRNIADHYFGLDEDYNFFDLDVLAAGPVVADVSDGFDLFWNSAAAYPGGELSRRGQEEDVATMRAEMAAQLEAERETRLRSFPIEPASWERELSGLRDRMVEGRATFLQDDPDREKDERRVVTEIREMTNSQKGEVVFVTPYLIPSETAIGRLAAAREHGIRVGVLAPSLAANNQAAAHGHYVKKRRPLLDSGVLLFELKDQPAESLRALVDTPPVMADAVNLHAKAIVGDRSRCFVGSMNLDPRAMRINTESGLLIDSHEISEELFALLKEIAGPESAWSVTVDEGGRLVWRAGEEAGRRPPAKWSKRAVAFIVGLLPVESQL